MKFNKACNFISVAEHDERLNNGINDSESVVSFPCSGLDDEVSRDGSSTPSIDSPPTLLRSNRTNGGRGGFNSPIPTTFQPPESVVGVSGTGGIGMDGEPCGFFYTPPDDGRVHPSPTHQNRVRTYADALSGRFVPSRLDSQFALSSLGASGASIGARGTTSESSNTATTQASTSSVPSGVATLSSSQTSTSSTYLPPFSPFYRPIQENQGIESVSVPPTDYDADEDSVGDQTCDSDEQECQVDNFVNTVGNGSWELALRRLLAHRPVVPVSSDTPCQQLYCRDGEWYAQNDELVDGAYVLLDCDGRGFFCANAFERIQACTDINHGYACFYARTAARISVVDNMHWTSDRASDQSIAEAVAIHALSDIGNLHLDQ